MKVKTKNMIVYKGLRIDNHYNVAYFGGWREGKFSFSGFLLTVCDGKEFVVADAILGPKGQGLTVLNIASWKPIELKPWEYRFLNDLIHNKTIDLDPVLDDFYDRYPNIYAESIRTASDLWVKCKRYPLQSKNISANIQNKDIVIDLAKEEREFAMCYDYDSRLVNQNQFYQLKDRKHLHPRELTKEEFLNELKDFDPFVKHGFKECDRSEIKREIIWQTVEFESGEKILTYHNCNKDIYWIDFNGKLYRIHSNISAPFYDTLEFLKGNVFMKYHDDGCPHYYCLKKIKREHHDYSDFVSETRNEFWDEEKSYHYNNRLIKLTGNTPNYIESKEFLEW